jgi:hypothetical protein
MSIRLAREALRTTLRSAGSARADKCPRLVRGILTLGATHERSSPPPPRSPAAAPPPLGNASRWRPALATTLSTPRRGHNKSAQGRASRRQPQSDALGTVSIQHGSPERAKQIGSSHTHRSLDAARLVAPLQGWCSPSFITQGGATRLRRSALPWAAMWLLLRGENLWITRSGSPRGHLVIVDFVITPRSQTGTESGIRENTNSQ